MIRGFARFLRGNAIGLLALFVALGGTTYAASTALAPRNSVGSAQVINGSLQTQDLNNKARKALKGTRGAKGDKGDPGPFPATLPAGATLVGAYAISQGASVNSGSDWGASAISFEYPLAAAPTVVVVTDSNPDSTHCPGTSSAPAAASGYLCVYQADAVKLLVGYPDTCAPTTCGSGASKYGAIVRAFGAPNTERWHTWGTWAVTGS